MKPCILLFAMVALAMGAPAPEESKRSLPAVEHKEERDDAGQYKLRYVTAEGTIVSEHGHLVPTADGKDKVLVSDGEVTYVGPDGKSYVTKWSAGVEGMKVEGEHLPVAPAVPIVESVPVLVEPAPVVLPAPMLPHGEVLMVAY